MSEQVLKWEYMQNAQRKNFHKENVVTSGIKIIIEVLFHSNCKEHNRTGELSGEGSPVMHILTWFHY